jgi:signal recognition particle subunit SEC65
MEEWLQLETEDQRDLVFRALNKRFALAEWVLWAVHEAGGAWVAERPLVAIYRRWKRGEDWRDRLSRNEYRPQRTTDRESYTFATLVRIGLLEMGQWGQEKFYRLSPRGLQLLDPPDDDGFRQFYLTPSFEIMAPAGLAPILLFRIGELADLVGCDRANTYKITQPMIEQAMERGWRRDDVLQFLRDNSQIGVPDNVEATLKGWIGHRGDIEFHDVMLMTVHRSQIRRLEGHRRVKPYLLHRFAPGMYAVDRNRIGEIEAMLREIGFDPNKDRRRYPGDASQVEARQALRRMVAESRESAIDPLARSGETFAPERLEAVPGTRAAAAAPPEPPAAARGAETPEEIRALLDRAMSDEADVEIVYVAKNGQKMTFRVYPERLAFKSDAPVLVGLDRAENERRTYLMERIERLRIWGQGS